MRNRREDRTMATREINFQFVGGRHAPTESAFCIVSRAAIGHSRDEGCFLGCVGLRMWRRLSKEKTGALPSHVPEKKKN